MVVDWLGKPLAKNKQVDFFKTNSKNIPVNMFKDNDRDGVPNVFDCKPNNKNKQGFIDAIVGAVKGVAGGFSGVKAGFSQGWKQQGNPVGRALERRRIASYQNKSPPAKLYKKVPETREQAINRIMRARVAAQDEAARVRAKAEFRQNVNKVPGIKYTQALFSKIQRANPNYAREMKQKYWENRLQDPKLTPQQRSKIQYQMAKAANVRAGVVQKFRVRAAEMAFPVTSMSSYGSGSAFKTIQPVTSMSSYGSGSAFKTIQGVPGRGRGRPRGSLDKRYAQYGGVFGYRRYVSQQKKALRLQLQRQQQMMKMNAQRQMPQYEQQQYQPQQQEQQLPPEMQGQDITPEYSQAPQQMPQQMPQQQVQQQPFQYVQEEQKRPIGTVFKSSGGSPYAPVDTRPLAAPKQTIPYGYVETVDSFTGRRFLKPLPPKEGWTQ